MITVLARYSCGTRRVDVAQVGVCCTCGWKERQFGVEVMRKHGEPDDPGTVYFGV